MIPDFLNKKVGFYGLLDGHHHLGDSIVFSSFPENFYLNFKIKLIDMDSYWVFDQNPFVIRGDIPEVSFNLPDLNKIEMNNIFFPSIVAKINSGGPLKLNVHLNKPKLYINEHTLKTNTVCIHLGGKTFNEPVSNTVINYILTRYRDFNIYQIGGQDDKRINGTIDKRGLSIHDTANILAHARYFIGNNSSMMHLANCFEGISCKIILNRTGDNHLLLKASVRSPQESKYKVSGFDWLYPDNDIYNLTENDIGITKSYLSI